MQGRSARRAKSGRKLLVLLLTLVMLLGLCPTGLQAAGTGTETEEEACYNAAISQGSSLTIGKDVSLNITISNKVETSYTTYQLVVNYDADKLTYKSINTNAAVKDQDGVLTIIGFGSDRACETDKIVLTFTGKAAGQAEVSLISAKIDQAAHAADRDAPNANIVTPATATLTVKEKVLLGDMNGDGEITNADVAELLAKVTAREEVSLDVGDVNGDGEVTNADVVALLVLVTNG